AGIGTVTRGLFRSLDHGTGPAHPYSVAHGVRGRRVGDHSARTACDAGIRVSRDGDAGLWGRIERRDDGGDKRGAADEDAAAQAEAAFGGSESRSDNAGQDNETVRTTNSEQRATSV